jgi:Domain of unknown function (DUF4357)
MSIGTAGRSLELFFIDGRPDGMLTAEVFNWTGHVLMTPRTQIGEALKRREAKYTGVYLLIGERDGEPLAYIGEAEDIGYQIRSHDSNKDWWNIAILITYAANTLNKAHVRYLESRLIEQAKAVGKVSLENGTTPARPGLSEAAQANMETFLDYILMILPALRIDSFLKSTRPTVSAADPADPNTEPLLFELHTPKHGLHATARLENGELVVQAGSVARGKWVGEGWEHIGYARLYAELVKTGVLAEQGMHRVFRENYAFKSPSAAASVVNGRSSNGTTDWRVQGQSKTYKQWEAEKLAADITEVAA